jgi:hypothetical protein
MEPFAVQIQRKGLVIDQAQVGKLCAEFRETHWVRLPQLLEPSILDFLQARLDNSQWESMSHGKIGEEYITNDLPTTSLLHFVMNRPKFRTVIEEITDRKGLQWFRGRVYRMIAGAGHHDNWHSDMAYSNEIGMSLNLSRNIFRGGLFMLQESGSKRVLTRVANTGPGDALIFRISPDLHHRISDLEGDEPKTAFAGWFKSSLPECFRDSSMQVPEAPQEI